MIISQVPPPPPDSHLPKISHTLAHPLPSFPLHKKFSNFTKIPNTELDSTLFHLFR